MRKTLLLLWGLLALSATLLAQTRTITGKVTDAEGKPVPNASITVKGVTTGTTTHSDGSFTLTVSGNIKQLQVSSVGYEPQIIAIGGNDQVNVKLALSTTEIGAVVVTGYTKEKKGQFAGSASVISGKMIETVPVGSFDQALQGRAPGLLVNSGSGQPGSSPNITIRGVQSITGAGAQPLFVIDGVPIPAGNMQTMNPNDFESITVLKDASAAALYGARGGLGVIVITTKKGKAGVTNFSARSQVGFTEPPKSTNFDLMNTTEILQYEEREKLSGTPGWNYSKNNPAYAAASPATQALYTHLLDSISKINTDYSKLLFRNGFSQTHEISMSGGTDKTRFYLSGNYFAQDGTDLNSNLKRYTTRFNIDHSADKVTVQFNTAIGYSQTSFSEGEWLGNSNRNAFQMVWRAKPYENPYKPDGTLNYGSNSTLALKQIANLLEGEQNSSLKLNEIKINSGLTVAYRLLPYLTLKNTLGIDVADDRWQRYINPVSYIGSLQTFNAGIDAEATKLTTNIINTSSIVYANKFDKHEIEAGAYFEAIREYEKAMGLLLYNLDPRLSLTGQGAGNLPVSSGSTTYPQNSTSAKSGYGIRSYFFAGKYTYNGKYTITANARQDGTSRILNESNKEVFTWSVGSIWNAIQENFLASQDILTDLKVRASYGTVPNIGSISSTNYAINGYGTGFLAVTNYLGSQLQAFSPNTTFVGFPAGSVPITGFVPSSVGNANLKIEKVQKLNLGVDFALWQNRARFTVDWYNNRTVDLFVNKYLRAETGFGNVAQPINAGIMTNKGVEISASADLVKTNDFVFTFGINHSINKNKIQDLGPVDQYYVGTFLIAKGLPYGSHYTYHYLGADPQTGRPRYEKEDGTETTDVSQAGQFAKFGTYLPKHVGSFTGDFKYRNFSVNLLFTYQFDVVRSNNVEDWITQGTSAYQASVNGSKRLLTEQWQKPGDHAFYQGSGFTRGFTSADLQNAKFLRFRAFTVAYNVPQLSFKGTKIIKSARVYAQAMNIYIWSPWRGLDPEDSNNISLNEYPNPRAFVTGIDINF